MTSFVPRRELLNPKFEGYRLDPVAQDEIVTRVDLVHKASQSTVSPKSPLSFQEVQSRITHNHLFVSDSGRAIYVDVDFNVVSVDVASVCSKVVETNSSL